MAPARPGLPAVLAVVTLGGVAGALLRYGLLTASPDSPESFPWTIFAVNVVGCFALALLPGFAVVRRRPLLPPLLGTGVLGGFTTLSTYAEQTRALLASGHAVLGATYVVGTLAAGLLAAAVAGRFETPSARRVFADEGGDE